MYQAVAGGLYRCGHSAVSVKVTVATPRSCAVASFLRVHDGSGSMLEFVCSAADRPSSALLKTVSLAIDDGVFSRKLPSGVSPLLQLSASNRWRCGRLSDV